MILVGFGPGRCGTKTLAGLFGLQQDWTSTHEGYELSWFPGMCNPITEISDFADGPTSHVIDVGFYWIHYLTQLFETYPEARAINLVRSAGEIINSFWAVKKQFVKKHKIACWYGYPFDSYHYDKKSIKNSVVRYKFLEQVALKQHGDRIYQIQTKYLSDKAELKNMFDWCDIPNGIPVCLHLNSRANKQWHTLHEIDVKRVC